jgi:ATPase subunit of ABC transporter with duplicated ATPase domains
MAGREESVIRFENVSFEYGHDRPILDEVDFPIRRGSKIAVMGQNGAGKSTLFALITGALMPESGKVHRSAGLTIAAARQVIPRSEMELTMRVFSKSNLRCRYMTSTRASMRCSMW